MLVTLADILAEAEKGKYGVGLFNMLNLEMARGIIEAAEAKKHQSFEADGIVMDVSGPCKVSCLKGALQMIVPEYCL